MLEIRDISKVGNEFSLFELITAKGHEQVMFCYDRDTNLRTIIAVHSTALGPSLGGARMWQYSSDADALNDALRLSHAMTYKAAIAGVNFGGGKAVIIGNHKTEKTPALLRSFGKFVESLGGRYITAEDMGTNMEDMEIIHEVTKYVTGLPESMGGNGDPSLYTSYGVFAAMKACAKKAWGSDDLTNKKISVQGVGNVGKNLIALLHKAGARIFATDIYEDKLQKVAEEFGCEIVRPNDIYKLDVDILAPCAQGGVINADTISQLKCQIICGSANNPLEDDILHENLLREHGILYIPSFVINAGGLISVYHEYLGDHKRDEVMKMVEKIYDVTLNLFREAERTNTITFLAAQAIAEKRIREAKERA